MRRPRVRPSNRLFALGVFLALLGTATFFAASGGSPDKLSGRWTPGVYHLGNLVALEIPVPVQSTDFYLEGGLSEGRDWGKARIARILQVPPASFPGDLTLKVTVQVFDTGDVQLPPLDLQVHTAKGVNAYSITVPPVKITPLLPAGDQPQPAPAAPVSVPFPFPWVYVVAALAGMAALAVLLAVIVRRARRRSTRAAAKPSLKELDPDLWIRREVERLFRADIEPAMRYEALSTNLRDYLELTLQRPFLEWTSSEIGAACPSIPRLSGDTGDRLMGVFRLCDRVLFARYAPTTDDEREAMERTVEVLKTLSAPTQLEKAS